MANQFCDCAEDGYCPRYARDMRGRFRQICAAINCDLGTAAAFREQWLMEKDERDNLLPIISNKIPICLQTNQAPGDALVMTAAIYSLHKAYPGKYITNVISPYRQIFYYNPDTYSVEYLPVGYLLLNMHYPAIHQSNQRGIHFMQGWCEFLGKALNINVPLLTNKPHLYFDTPTPAQEDYWIICSGGKSDFTNKLWGHDNYQKVVSSLKNHVQFVQVGGSYSDHQPLDNLYINMIALTTLRGLFDLVRRCKGVVCGVSLLMHIAAALDKPAIVIAGGREPVQWNSYPKQHYLHTVGMLPCKDAQGNSEGVACWRGRVRPLGDGTALDRNTCERPVCYNNDVYPECMALIKPETVCDLVMRYKND